METKRKMENRWRSNSVLRALGLIHVGDELKEVNGIPVDDKKPEEIIHILVSPAEIGALEVFRARLPCDCRLEPCSFFFHPPRPGPKGPLPSKLSPALKRRCPPKRQRCVFVEKKKPLKEQQQPVSLLKE